VATIPSWTIPNNENHFPEGGNKWIRRLIWGASGIVIYDNLRKGASPGGDEEGLGFPPYPESNTEAKISEYSEEITDNAIMLRVIVDIEYSIQKNDNLTEIAKKFNTTVGQLQEWNNISDENKNIIPTGGKLKVDEKDLSVSVNPAVLPGDW
jgi:hypothetical protein